MNFILHRFMKPCSVRENTEANICLNVVDVDFYLGLTIDLNFWGGGSLLTCSVADRACGRTGLLNFCKDCK